MSKSYELTGKVYGKLTVIERAENNKRNNSMWLCVCECGNEKEVLGYDLESGRCVSCGCKTQKKGIPSKNRIDLTGNKYGMLTVVGLSEKRGYNNALYWKCICECGNTKESSGSNLKSGRCTHCGCKKRISPNRKNLVGKKFGRLTVLQENDNVCECICDCGNAKIAKRTLLLSGNTLSCGCYAEEVRKRKKEDSYSKTRLYSEWRSMINRCKQSYHCNKSYYQKGIQVCEEWINSFDNFRRWANDNGYEDCLTLDRIDNEQGYNPSNCRWVDQKTQQNNKSNNVYIEYNGKTQTLKQWCDELNLNYGMVKRRRQKGWEIPRLFDEKHTNQYK